MLAQIFRDEDKDIFLEDYSIARIWNVLLNDFA